jgi:hypothetical protein
MDASRQNFCTIEEILHDVTNQVDDERMEFLSKGFYVSQIQQCLEELAFETFFDKQQMDFNMPKDRILDLPAGFWNPEIVYVFYGDSCVVGRSQKVWWKRNFNSRKTGYFGINKGFNPSDPFLDNNGLWQNRRLLEPNDLNLIRYRSNFENNYYYNIVNGQMHFSLKCATFEKIHIEFHGTGCPIGEVPFIPLFFRQTVKDYVCEVGLRIRLAKDKDPRWKNLWTIYDRNLNKYGDHGFCKGSWYNAEYRMKTMNASDRNDLKEYLSRNAWQ